MMSEQDINKVSLEVDGKIYDGWKSVHIEAGINRICRSFAVAATYKFPGNDGKFTQLEAGQLVKLKIGEDVVCTGYITSTPVDYNAKNITVQVQGKSKTVDLVDCCSPWKEVLKTNTKKVISETDSWKDVDPEKNKAKKVVVTEKIQTSWHDQTTQKIIADLCKPYGISVLCESEIGTKHTNFTVNPGEKVYESINRLLTKDNLIVTDDEFGNLVITEPGSGGKCYDSLTVGENVLTGSAKFDSSQIYQEYLVLGQHKGGDDSFGKHASQDKGTAHDLSCKRYRMLVIKDSGQSSAEIASERAKFEKSYRRARYFEFSYTLQGWRQRNRQLWKINSLVTINDKILEIEIPERSLITDLVFDLNSSGTICSLVTVPLSGYHRDGAKSTNDYKTKAVADSSFSWKEVK